MELIEIDQFKEFKKEFEFDLRSETFLHLRTIPSITFNSKVLKMSKEILDKILDSSRPSKHTETTILYSYILYLCNFMKGHYDNFDKIYQYIQRDKSNIRYFDLTILREIEKYEKINITI